METLKLLLTHFALPSVVIGAVTYLARQMIGQLLSRDIERFKSQRLLEVEEFKRDLSVAQFERQTRFANVHSKRAEVAAELYELIVAANIHAHELIKPLQMISGDKDTDQKAARQRKIAAAEAYTAARVYFEKKRLYLGSKAVAAAQRLFNLMGEAIIVHDISQGRFSGGEVDVTKWVEAWSKISEEVPKVLSEIEKEFHAMLGIND